MTKVVAIIVIALTMGIGLVMFFRQNQPAPESQNLVRSESQVTPFQQPNLNEESETTPEASTFPTPSSNASLAENTQAIIKTNKGNITISFYVNDAPKTVNNFINLANRDFYDGIIFHRVIDDFMIQVGDPNTKDKPKNTWGTGGPGYQFEDEINSHKLVRGSVAMANSGPDTNGSQFFIVTTDETPWLDGKHTNFGEVVDGMNIAESIVEGDRILDIEIIEN